MFQSGHAKCPPGWPHGAGWCRTFKHTGHGTAAWPHTHSGEDIWALRSLHTEAHRGTPHLFGGWWEPWCLLELWQDWPSTHGLTLIACTTMGGGQSASSIPCPLRGESTGRINSSTPHVSIEELCDSDSGWNTCVLIHSRIKFQAAEGNRPQQSQGKVN